MTIHEFEDYRNRLTGEHPGPPVGFWALAAIAISAALVTVAVYLTGVL